MATTRVLKVAAAAALCISLVHPAVAVPRSEARAAVTPDTEVSPDSAGVSERARPDGENSDFVWHITDDGWVLMAEERDDWRWQHVVHLPGSTASDKPRLTNACLSESGRYLVATQASYSAQNDPLSFSAAGEVWSVDLVRGSATAVDVASSLAYFSPSCGKGDTATVVAYDAMESMEEPVKSLVTTFDAENGSTTSASLVTGQITSAVWDGRAVIAAAGRRLVSITEDGDVTTLLETRSVPYDLAVTAAGGVAFVEHADGMAFAKHLGENGRRDVESIASAPLQRLGLHQLPAGRVAVATAAGASVPLPNWATHIDAENVVSVSRGGRVAVAGEPNDVPVGDAQQQRDVSLAGKGDLTVVDMRDGARISTPLSRRVTRDRDSDIELSSDETATSVNPLDIPLVGDLDPTVQRGRAEEVAPDSSPSCAVPRNDAELQVYQATPRQVEWATNQAVVNNLMFERPADWKGNDLPAYEPQTMFPAPALAGGGRVHSQALLGILAQESNLKQASWHALTGVTANPLVGNYYGRSIYDSDSSNDWDIDFSDADCGYGVAQVTDGMRLQGQERPGETALPPEHQIAVGTDYTANIAAGTRILVDKWNQLYTHGVVHENGDPKWLENWFLASWAYNSGFYPPSGEGEPWGVGWFNNPANPIYPPNRGFFNEVGTDAAHPQDWPYPEKVLGWGAYSQATPDGPGFRPAWWVSVQARDNARPPIYTFCGPSNTCEPGEEYQPTAPGVSGAPAGPCAHQNGAGEYDLKCWWHMPVTWNACSAGYCGNELHRFDTSYPEQPDGTNYPPACDLWGLPHWTGTLLVVDNVGDSIKSVRPNCPRPHTNAGHFELAFPYELGGDQPAKVDFHQIGGGFAGHFWFAHTRSADANRTGDLRVEGTWRFDEPLNGWGRVYVHMPDHGAHTQQAAYRIDDGTGTEHVRYALQRTREHRWVSLGAVEFSGTPSVTLSTDTFDGDGEEDVAWDAVAIQPLPGKPDQMVAVLGDSYISGEGANDPADGDDYLPETDSNGHLPIGEGRNACHRSELAWAYKLNFDPTPDPDNESMGWRHRTHDDDLDFQFHACSGATTGNILTTRSGPSSGQFSEVSQLQKGYVTNDTTHVFLSIGGNDAGFGAIMKECIIPQAQFCHHENYPGTATPMEDYVPQHISGTVRDNIEETIQAIHAAAPNAAIYLVGYPKLFPDPYPTPTVCVYGIHYEEGTWMNDMSDLMRDTQEVLVDELALTGVPVDFIDPMPEFVGSSMCEDPQGLHELVLDKTEGDSPDEPASRQSYHPTIYGYDLYAEAVEKLLNP